MYLSDSHIKSIKQNPRELEPREIVDLVKRWKDTRDKKLAEQLLNLYLPLIDSLAYKYGQMFGNRDDLLQSGIEGLFHGLEAYDSRRGTKVITRIWFDIKGFMLRAIKKELRELIWSYYPSGGHIWSQMSVLREFNIDTTKFWNADRFNKWEFEDLEEEIISKELDRAITRVLIEEVQVLYKNKKYEKLITMLLKEVPQIEIAKELSITPQRVHELKRKIFNRFKNRGKIKKLRAEVLS